MLRLLSIMLLFLLQNPIEDPVELRKRYHNGIYDEKAAVSIYNELGNFQAKNNLQTGYYGASVMMLAKHTLMPNKRLSYFYEGKKILEKAIGNDPENPELIYLRFSIQTNVPGFLGYNKNLVQDKQLLLRKVKEIKDRDLRKYILSFLIAQGNLTEQERKSLN